MTTCFHSCTKCNAKFMFKKQLEQHINREHSVCTPTYVTYSRPIRTSAFMESILGTASAYTTSHSFITTGQMFLDGAITDSW